MAIPKLNIVTISTYLVLMASPSLNLKIDFAAIRKPTASNCPRTINASNKKHSTMPISFPAFGRSSPGKLFAFISNARNNSFITILAGFAQKI